MTDFSIVYDSFLSKITDDMYLELTELDTFRLLQELLISAIPSFEFPRIDLFDYECQEVVDLRPAGSQEDQAVDRRRREVFDACFFQCRCSARRPYVEQVHRVPVSAFFHFSPL